ncbi:MAG: hypothetical protein ABSF24_02385 [Candidatus Bathyarchaeia archaeon]|jgi:hypothetical protein
MLKQVEFLIRGSLLPSTIGQLQVCERFVLEQVFGENESAAIAYFGVEDAPDYFITASSYVDFFLLLNALLTGRPATYRSGIGTTISALDELGRRRVSFTNYRKVTVLDEDMGSILSESILLTKERFLHLEKDMQRIMDEQLGLALRYYYNAVQASSRMQVEVVIDLAIAAEALFSTGGNYKSNLKRRLSSFIEPDELKREEMAKQIGKFYDLRGAIVHGGRKEIPLVDVRIAGEYIRKALDKALSSKLYTKEDLLQEADKP